MHVRQALPRGQARDEELHVAAVRGGLGVAHAQRGVKARGEGAGVGRTWRESAGEPRNSGCPHCQIRAGGQGSDNTAVRERGGWVHGRGGQAANGTRRPGPVPSLWVYTADGTRTPWLTTNGECAARPTCCSQRLSSTPLLLHAPLGTRVTGAPDEKQAWWPWWGGLGWVGLGGGSRLAPTAGPHSL